MWVANFGNFPSSGFGGLWSNNEEEDKCEISPIENLKESIFAMHLVTLHFQNCKGVAYIF